MEKSNFCVMPFTHINIKHEGKLSPCYRYPDRIGDYGTMTLEETWNSESLRTLRKQLLNGEKPIGCRSCWDLEDSKVTSTRQSCNNLYPYVNEDVVNQALTEDYAIPLGFLSTIEVRFDNICNLMCRHCSPDYSSVWEIAVSKNVGLYDQMKKYQTFRKLEDHVNLTDSVIDEITNKLAPNLKSILISGGEPLYHDKHYSFLESLLPNADHIELSYNSNFSTLSYKGKSILELWEKFKKVVVRVSIDSDRELYDYIRVNGKIQTVEQNIIQAKKLKNIVILGTCTTSILNITRLPSIVKYFTDLDVYFHTSLVQYPKALNVKLLPKELKKRITDEWREFLLTYTNYLNLSNFTLNRNKQMKNVLNYGNNVIDYMNSADWSSQIHEFIDYATAQDQYHNTKFYEIYPEFKDFITSTKTK